ncbi:Glutathione S-transferase DHAR2 [Hordeum vulgare]|nr:Glutathione S-transferase DHAR2 [Hordeum vulgare]
MSPSRPSVHCAEQGSQGGKRSRCPVAARAREKGYYLRASPTAAAKRHWRAKYAFYRAWKRLTRSSDVRKSARAKRRQLARHFCGAASRAPIKGSTLPLPRATAPRSLSLSLSRRRRRPPPQSAATAPARRPRRATMPPRRRSALGYRGVRQRPNDGFYAEIRSGDLRLSLGTYDTTHEAARAFDATAWRLGRPHLRMNFPDVHTLQQALDLAPPPRLNSAQDRAEHTALQRRLLVAQEDERVMAEWRRHHPGGRRLRAGILGRAPRGGHAPAPRGAVG